MADSDSRFDRLAARGRILAATREFFADEGFVEVETPALQVSPGIEPHLKAFATLLNDPRDNSLKPRYLPGERLSIKIIKPGEGAGQGVGYLDDGTMVVCEDGGSMIGKEADVVVKSVLQSSAGRMIFGRLPTATQSKAS